MGAMDVSLPDPMKSWVEDQAKSGRYANCRDYVRDLIGIDDATAPLGRHRCAKVGLR